MNQSFFSQYRVPVLYAGMALLLVIVGVGQGWSVSLSILNLCLISAIMSLGVNMQWGYAGLFNVGVMGFAALGGLAAVLVSMPPIDEAQAAGGSGILVGVLILIATIFASIFVWKQFSKSK
jgi:branched-chain amino acid transport system permease protein